MHTAAVNLPADATVRRILIIKWSALGDVVLASALFEDIHRAFADREIHLNVLPPWDALFREDPRFHQVFASHLRDRHHPIRALRQWLSHVRRMRYDLVIDLQSNDRSRLLLALLRLGGRRIPYRVGNHLRFPYNIGPIDLPRSVHAATRMRAALQAAGIPAVTPRPVLHIPEHNRARARALQQAHGLQPGRYAVLMPGCQAAGYLKRWGMERYGALARRLHAAGLERIVLIGGADERDECRGIEQACGPWLVNLCEQTELFDLVPLCESARLIVANDTGTAHLAAVTTVPTTVLCGPTDPRRVKPLGDNVLALQADLPCRNCYRKHCSHHSCMAMLTPPLVFRHLWRTGQLPKPG